jgi:hypothetical protein
MAISAATRKRLPKSSFALPSQRKYPIHDLKHARAALARAAQKKTAGSYSTVAKAVRKKWGNKVASVGKARGTVSRPGYRRGATKRSGRRR